MHTLENIIQVEKGFFILKLIHLICCLLASTSCLFPDTE